MNTSVEDKILGVLADGKPHTARSIASILEVSDYNSREMLQNWLTRMAFRGQIKVDCGEIGTYCLAAQP